MVSHANVSRLLVATQRWFNFGAADVWTLFHSYAFDFSVWEIYGALLHGGRLVVVPYWISRSPDAFYELLAEEAVTVLNQTPTAFQQLMRVEEVPEKPRALALRLVIFGGEALELQSLRPWFERHGDEQPQLVNMYGITETTVHVTYRALVSEDAEGAGGSVIGRQIPDLQIYILDGQGRLVAAGIPGELYVGGAGVARGYLNRADLTALRFVPHPFSRRPGARLYRTGDLARWSEAGELEYLGRNDQQVKIRGHRIETGEIESALLERVEVGQAIVLVREEEGRGKQLAAFVVSSNGIEPSRRDLRSYLQERLPEYMVPGSIAVLDKLPLTTNGKIDRKSLLSLSVSRTPAESEHEGARNEVEEVLAQVWQEVLGIERVGIHDNFFELGGDSILSIQVVAKAKRGGLTLKVQQIFQHQTIAGLALVAAKSTEQAAAEQDAAVGEVVLTPIQLRFFELGLRNPHHFNQALMLEGHLNADFNLLEVVFKRLAEHHDALRLRFTETADGWRQSYAEVEEHQLVSAIDLSHLALDEQRREIETHAATAQSSLDISNGPLLRVVLFDLGDESPARLLIAIHHLAIGGVSWRILIEDLQTAFEQAHRGQGIELPGKTNSFKRWAESLRQYALSAELNSETSYWLDECRRSVQRLPVDYEAGENTVASAGSIQVELSREETQALLQEVPKAYHTQIHEVLVTALALALKEWAGANKLLIDMEGHGREEVVAGVDVSRTLGWFTSVYPVLLELEGNEISTALKSIKEQLREVPKRGIGYGIWRYLKASEAEQEKLGELAAAEVSFNYLGQFDQVLSGEGFRAAAESTGPVQDERAKREHLLAINGMVANGQLRMSWGYSEAVHRSETIEHVAEYFATALRELIVHCQSEEAGGHTPSDFPLASLDQESLDSLMTSLEAF
jgi:non-ribosomal peptide synthase protein (TIGR01720 family)